MSSNNRSSNFCILNYTQKELEDILAKAKSGHVLTSAEYARVNQITEIKQQVEELKNNTSQNATYQTKVDNNLNTTNKNIVDAINELLSKVESNSSMISTAKKKLIDAIGAPLVEESTFNAIEQTLNDLTTTLQNALTDLGIATLTTDKLQALIEKVKTIEIPEAPEVEDISGLLETFRDILSVNGVSVSRDEELGALITKTEALIRNKNIEIDEYKTTVNNLNKRIDNLNERIVELERDIETLQEENTELNNNIIIANDTINNLNIEKAELNSTINSLNEEIRGLNDTINDLRNNVGNSATDNAALQQRVNELEDRVIELENRVTQSEGTNSQLNETITELQNTISRLEQQVNQSGSINTSLNNRIQELESEVASLQQQLNQSNGNNSSLQGNIAELQQRISDLESQIETLNQQLSQSGTTNTELQNTVNDLRSRVTELETQLNQSGSANTALQETVTALNTRVSELESQVSTLTGTVGTLTVQNQALMNEIDGLMIKVKQLAYANIPYHYIVLNNDKPFDLAARKPMGNEFEWSINLDYPSDALGIKQDTLLYGYKKGTYALDAKCKTTGYIFEKVLTVVVCNTASIEPGDTVVFEDDSIMNSLDGENEYLLYLDKEGDVITQSSFAVTLTKEISQANIYGKDHISMHFSDTSICNGSINVGSNDTYYLITGKKAGTCFVTIESHGLYGVFRGLSFKVNVKYTVYAESIQLNTTHFICSDLSSSDGVQQTLQATVLPEDTTNKTITWRSSDTNVATVSSDGVITVTKDSATGQYRNGYGYCEIIGTCGNATATCKVYLLSNDRFYIFSKNNDIGINEDVFTIKENNQWDVTILQQNIPRQTAKTKNLVLNSRQSVSGSFFYYYPEYGYEFTSKNKIDLNIFDKLEIDTQINNNTEGHSYNLICLAIAKLYQEKIDNTNEYIDDMYRSFKTSGINVVSISDYKSMYSSTEAYLYLDFLTKMENQVNGAQGAGYIRSDYVCLVCSYSVITGNVSAINEDEEENNTIIYIKGSEINE